jgi:hypothetical protein
MRPRRGTLPAKFLSLVSVALLLATNGCAGSATEVLKPGMSQDAALTLLSRADLKAEDVTGAQVGRTFQVSSPAAEDALCFDVETHRVTRVYWYRNWRADLGKPKAARVHEVMRVPTITPEEIRAGLAQENNPVSR